MEPREPDSAALRALPSNRGSKEAKELTCLVYDDLRSQAARSLHRNPDCTLDPTDLVHATYLRLIDISRIDWCGETHFKAMAALTMRRVLIDHARENRAQKRGGDKRPITLSGITIAAESRLDAQDLVDALAKLRTVQARQADFVELRIYGGLTLEQAATEIGVSVPTAKKDWRLARAWLNRELSK